MTFFVLKRVILGSEWCARWRVAAIGLTAGVAAGLLSWTACEWAHDVFSPETFCGPQMGCGLDEPTRESRYAADLKNAALANAVLGCAGGFALGLAGGLAARAPSRGIFVGMTAQAVGLLIGALAALALIPLSHPVIPRPFRPVTDDVWLPLVTHAGLWTSVAAVAGSAFAIGAGYRERLPNALASAAAGAIFAAVCFQLIGMSLSVDSGATNLVAQWSIVRFVAMLLPSVAIATGAALGTLDHTHRVRRNH